MTLLPVLCCAVLCCAVLRCAVLCYALPTGCCVKSFCAICPAVSCSTVLSCWTGLNSMQIATLNTNVNMYIGAVSSTLVMQHVVHVMHARHHMACSQEDAVCHCSLKLSKATSALQYSWSCWARSLWGSLEQMASSVQGTVCRDLVIIDPSLCFALSHIIRWSPCRRKLSSLACSHGLSWHLWRERGGGGWAGVCLHTSPILVCALAVFLALSMCV